MTQGQQSLIATARQQYGDIHPCSGKRSLLECFTREPEYGWMLWFNDTKGNTHIILEKPGRVRDSRPPCLCPRPHYEARR